MTGRLREGEVTRGRLRVLVALAWFVGLSAEGRAQAQEPQREGPAEPQPAEPTPHPPSSDADLARRYDELLERQQQLEARVDTAGSTATEAAHAPLAGYSERNFFLRDANDWFVLIPKGRLNLDYYSFLSRPQDPPGGIVNGPADTRPKDGLFIRRARWGIAGTFVKHIDFRVEAEFANVPSQGQYASLTDASMVINYTPLLQIEAGQFYAPFTLENPTSENYTDFMEKAAAVRFAVPTSRETGIMLLGEAPHGAVRYWVGLFDGEGQNFKNLDYGAAVIGRAIFAPLALLPEHEPWQERVWVGGSAWVQRTQNLGGTSAASTTGATQGDLSSVTTQAGLPIFNSNYGNGVDASNSAVRTHLAQNGTVEKYALELNVPLFERLGVRAEFNHQKIEINEYNDTTAGRTPGAPGALRGSGGYAELYVWLGQHVNVDHPGLYQTPHWSGYKKPGPPTVGVMLAAKYEHVGFDVDGLPTTTQRGKQVADAGGGSYSLDVFELGASLWMTRHSRLMANYVLNYIGAADNAAPNEQKNLFFRTNDHELLFRLAMSL
jgi:phosphate-selective porin